MTNYVASMHDRIDAITEQWSNGIRIVDAFSFMNAPDDLARAILARGIAIGAPQAPITLEHVAEHVEALQSDAPTSDAWHLYGAQWRQGLARDSYAMMLGQYRPTSAKNRNDSWGQRASVRTLPRINCKR